MADLTDLIVYACPTGPLAEQLDSYFAESLRACGPNTAHAYMPHVTLTGFFHDAPSSAPAYRAAIEGALAEHAPARPPRPVTVARMELGAEFHGLLVESPWLEAVAAGFAARAASPTRADAIRLKGWLHLSLAYGFPPAQADALAALARRLVDPQAPAGWELRLYRREPGPIWEALGAWEVAPPPRG